MKKRSKYRPRGVIMDAVNWVVAGVKPLSSVGSEAVNLKIKNHDALDLARTGQATRVHLDVLIAALNMTEALALANLGKDWTTEIRAGQDALLAMAQRGRRNDNRFVFAGPELTAVNLVMEIHDAQLDACTVQQLERAIVQIRTTERAGKARKIAA